jgi:hypothetical protein
MLRNDQESSQRCFDAKVQLFALLLGRLTLEEACCVVHEVREQLLEDLQRRRVTLQRSAATALLFSRPVATLRSPPSACRLSGPNRPYYAQSEAYRL